MYLIKNRNTDPAFNLALEEFFVSNSHDEFFALWQNAPSVIIGRNQDALAEINMSFIKEHNIKLVRRSSGGGAVFHDLGNVNYSYISESSGNDFLDFKHFSSPVISALDTLGVHAEVTGRNDITVDGKKISGNAQYIRNDRILHHGTLLFDSNFTNLSGALNADPRKLKGKGVPSVRSRVTNISSYLREAMPVAKFIEYLEEYILSYFSDISVYELSRSDIDSINDLADKKYRSDVWNLVHMGKYSFRNSAVLSSGIVDIGFNVNDGIITDMNVTGDFFGKKEIADIYPLLKGTVHTPYAVSQALADISLSEYISGCSNKEFVSLFF